LSSEDNTVFENPRDARVQDLQYKHTILLGLNDIRRNSAWEVSGFSDSARNLRNIWRRIANLETYVGPYAKSPDYLQAVNEVKKILKKQKTQLMNPKFDRDEFFLNLMVWETCLIQQLGRVKILPKIYEPILWGLKYDENRNLIPEEEEDFIDDAKGNEEKEKNGNNKQGEEEGKNP